MTLYNAAKMGITLLQLSADASPDAWGSSHPDLGTLGIGETSPFSGVPSERGLLDAHFNC